jgi:beta-N-acetylhexosaminidase
VEEVPHPLPRRARVAALLAGGLLLAACADGAGPDLSAASDDRAEASPTPDCTPAPLEQRAGAVLVVGLPGVTEADDPLVQEVLDVGVSGVFLVQENVVSKAQLTALTAGLREQAGRPFLVSTDEEGGRVSVTRALLGSSPSPRRLAAQRTPEEVRERAAELGADLAELGVNLDLAPGLDLDAGPSGGIIGDRSFSAEPQKAADYGLAFARGLADSGVLPTVKHFPGHGRSATDTHDRIDVVETSVDELRDTDLLPFQEAVDAGVPVVMLNHLAYSAFDPDLPASLAPEAYALLREMGFEGVAITDSLGMGAVHARWDFPESARMAVAAGADLALGKDGRLARAMRDEIVAAVESGAMPEERLDEAAARATALAGGDPEALTCRSVTTPQLEEPAVSSAGSAAPTPTGNVTPTGTVTPGP